ncbi:MAG TPA: hypothetical protein VFZ87_09395 [Gemmatimonadales bacterium]
MAGGTDDFLPQGGELRCPFNVGLRRLVPVKSAGLEEGVPLADEAVQVRQGSDLLGTIGRIVGDHGQPEPKLGEPNSRRVAVNSEQVMPQHVPFPLCHRSTR